MFVYIFLKSKYRLTVIFASPFAHSMKLLAILAVQNLDKRFGFWIPKERDSGAGVGVAEA